MPSEEQIKQHVMKLLKKYDIENTGYVQN